MFNIVHEFREYLWSRNDEKLNLKISKNIDQL